MKKLLLNNSGIASIIIGILFIICVSFTSEYKKETKIFVSNNAQTIKTVIEGWTKYGYEVESITPQSVSNSFGGEGCFGKYEIIKGDMILIMIKKN